MVKYFIDRPIFAWVIALFIVLLALVVLDGMSYRDAAETLAIPIGTVMSRIARARRAIDIFVHGDRDNG